jgi:hypothetical protein
MCERFRTERLNRRDLQKARREFPHEDAGQKKHERIRKLSRNGQQSDHNKHDEAGQRRHKPFEQTAKQQKQS